MAYTLLVQLFLVNLYAEAISTKLIPETGTPPSPRVLSGIVVDSDGKYLYIYGGGSVTKHSDMWKFDLPTPTWTQIYPASVLTPGPRSSSFMTTLKNDTSKILLYGGDTSNGPISDVWIYDTDNESVIYIQWKLIDDKGKAPPRASDRLDLETFTWNKQVTSGSAPLPYLGMMVYYNSSLLLGQRNSLFKLELSTGVWSTIEISDEYKGTNDKGLCIYKDHLYGFFGWDLYNQINFIYKIDLSEGKYDPELMYIDKFDEEFDGSIYGCRDNMIYIFGKTWALDNRLFSLPVMISYDVKLRVVLVGQFL